MKKFVIFWVLTIFLLGSNALLFSSDLSFNLGLRGYYNSTKIKYKDVDIEKPLSFTSLGVGGTFNLNDTFYISFYGGINSSKFTEDIQFDRLPFSINIPSFSSSGLFFDGKFSFFPFEIKGVELGGSFGVMALYTKDLNWDMSFPIVSGTFNAHFGFYNLLGSIEAKSEISDNLTLQGGFTILKTLGNIHGEEEIAKGELSSIEDIDFSNSIIPGGVITARYSIEDYVEIAFSANFLNTMTFSLSLNYIF